MGLAPNWTKYVSDDGKDYYHNSVTNVTQWDPPEGSVTNSDDVYKPDLKDLDLSSTSIDRPSFEANSYENNYDNNIPVGKPIPVGKQMPIGNMTTPITQTKSNDLDGLVDKNSPWYMRFCTCISVSKLQPYFDLTTVEFTDRLRLAINPLSKSAVDMNEKPDFYGPFWIVTTAIIFLAGTANYGNILIKDEGAEYYADWNLVYIAASCLYGSLISVPFLVSVVLKFFGTEGGTGTILEQKLTIPQFICVWGYSFTWLIPCAMFCLVPSDIAKTIIVILSFLASCIFVRNNLWQDMGIDMPKARYALIALLFGSHAVIYLLFRVYFIHHTHATPEVLLRIQAEKEAAAAAAASNVVATTTLDAEPLVQDPGAAASIETAVETAKEVVAEGAGRLLTYLTSRY